ncbi:MAG: hypothetical protein H6Q90_2715 [Deltaproteobacteria bacterium]|nr:hypothetical protein [Deltaproteobacteria bacterium]
MRSLLTASLVTLFGLAITGCSLYFTGDSSSEAAPPDAGSQMGPFPDAGNPSFPDAANPSFPDADTPCGGDADQPDAGEPLDAQPDDANPWSPDAGAPYPDAAH